jgi:hypothetical protein
MGSSAVLIITELYSINSMTWNLKNVGSIHIEQTVHSHCSHVALVTARRIFSSNKTAPPKLHQQIGRKNSISAGHLRNLNFY